MSMKHWRYRLEALLLHVLFFLFGALPPAAASSVGGFLARSIGPRLAASRKATRNLDMIFPDMPPAEKRIIVRDMWDNLGQVIAEYPHLETIAATRVDVVGADIMKSAIAKAGPLIFIGGHVGNWELNGATLFKQFGKSIDLTYRVPNNPYVDGLLTRARTLQGRLGAFPKARDTARKLVKSLQDGRYLGILFDQKFNTGIKSDFLGRPAMTNPAPFQLAAKFGCPLIPVFCERLPGCRFKMHVLPPLDTKDKTVEEITDEANAVLGDWIKTHPGQWLWIHRRWKSKALMN
ncbi:MAG: lysophospholipid acyltransferase family protein [Alphaproteobacteria bacterium]|nr:lysophospholipid acyltransferase family protein [Alphaproteobacteria bacterium]MCD8520058.1 lysophospholipid acyltransferase family protein [Alphaproteobacteria bacterium]MCD8525678.1 lysophospholipid acyltransferase family protein [Alphaproteobacteria bacterium]MCD8570930.1 lysophospholipid acyltransferase family protein [Alphaproteobacteria bacterium]